MNDTSSGLMDIDADRVSLFLDQATPLAARISPLVDEITPIVAGIRESMALPAQQENLLAALMAQDGGIRTREYLQRNVMDMVRGYGNLTPEGQESILDAALTQDGGDRLKRYIQKNVLEPADATATPYRVGMVASLIFVGLCIVALIITLVLVRRNDERRRQVLP